MWRAALLGVLLLGLGSAYGFAVGRYQVFPYEPLRQLKNRIVRGPAGEVGTREYGRWTRARERRASPLDRATEDELSALGYLGAYSPAEGEGGVTALDPRAMRPGLTLFTSGHAPVALLIDAAGAVVHEWQVRFEDLWPRHLPIVSMAIDQDHIRRARVLPDGDLLGVFDYIGMFRLDRDSRILWKSLSRSHHDFKVLEDGTILSLLRDHLSADDVASRYPGLPCPEAGIYDDVVAFFDASGTELRRASVLRAFLNSPYAGTLIDAPAAQDLFHANSVHLVGTDAHPLFSEGEVLVSLRNLNALVTVDVDAERITWMLVGMWSRQHQAELLENGNVLLLDNRGGNLQEPWLRDRSQVLEVDPLRQRIVWRYGGSEESPFLTESLGYAERLDNGNTLVSESTQGRIFEVSKEGRIVWEYLNPHRAGEADELIANVMGAQRIDPSALDFLPPDDRQLEQARAPQGLGRPSPTD